MSTEIGKYVDLKSVVSYVLDQHDLNYQRYFDKCWILAFRGMIDMGFDMAFEPKTIKLQVNQNQTANFPNDYVSWTKIGLQDSNGEISTLKINKALTTFRDNSPNRIQDLAQVQVNSSIGELSATPLFLNYYYNGTYSNLFGVGGGLIQYGECRVDEANRVIIFPPDFRFQSVLFEYLSSPQRDDDYQIELCLQEALIAFIEWKLKLNTDTNYYARLTSARRRMSKKKVTLQMINQVIRESDAMKLRS